jgi:hypothetical protein
MIVRPDQPAPKPFWFSECFIMPMPIGKFVTNLRELLQALKEVDEAVLCYHLWQSRLTFAHPAVEYPNDFAFWAATALQDSILAEKLSSFDPFEYENTIQMREALVEVLEDYLWNLQYVPWARPGFEFHFCESSIVVLHSHIVARTLDEFCTALRKVGLDSIYYHFVDARWRLRQIRMDDFSHWFEDNYDLPQLVSAIAAIDISFYTLDEVRNSILDLINHYLGVGCGGTE